LAPLTALARGALAAILFATAICPAMAQSPTQETLPNGVTLILSPNTRSNVVGMEIVSRVGTRYEEPEEAGLAALTLRVVMDGAGSQTGATLSEWFEDRGATVEARTHPDYSEIGSDVMASDFPKMAHLLADLATHASLSLGSFQSEQRSTVQLLQSEGNDDEAATYRSLRTLLADGTAYGRSETGLASTVSKLTPHDVHAFYEKMFAPDELIVAVSGRFDASDGARLLRSLFGAIPAQPAAPAAPALKTVVVEPSSMVLAGTGDAAWIMVGYLTPGVKSPDYPALAVLNALLGGSSSGSITSLFRDQNGVYDSGSFIQPFADQTHIVGYVRADPLLWDQDQQKLQPLVDQYQKQLLGAFEAIRDHGVTEEQVEVARAYVAGQYLQAREHNRGYAGYLGWYDAIGLGPGFDSRFLDEVRKVTPDQIARIARTCFAAGLGATVVMLPRPQSDEGP